jgi:xanthine dehydrogenase YagR molybdenum-binding subunit
VWGIGAALREASEVDPRYGGFLNADLAEYVLPVNADIGSIDVEFIDEPDFQFNSAGAKGLGEVSMTGERQHCQLRPVRPGSSTCELQRSVF